MCFASVHSLLATRPGAKTVFSSLQETLLPDYSQGLFSNVFRLATMPFPLAPSR